MYLVPAGLSMSLYVQLLPVVHLTVKTRNKFGIVKKLGKQPILRTVKISWFSKSWIFGVMQYTIYAMVLYRITIAYPVFLAHNNNYLRFKNVSKTIWRLIVTFCFTVPELDQSKWGWDRSLWSFSNSCGRRDDESRMVLQRKDSGSQ